MNKEKEIMDGNKDGRGEVSWKTVKNTLPNRMSSDSFKNDLHVKSRIKKRTKIVNSTLRQYSCLKSYGQYLNIKRSLLEKISVDEESDCDLSINSKISAASHRNLDCSSSSGDDEVENDYYQYDDVFIGENPKLSSSESEDDNFSWNNKPSKTWTENKSSEIRSHSASIREQNTSSRKSVQPSTSGKSVLRKPTRDLTKQANLNENRISNFEKNHAEEEEVSETFESPPLTRFSLRKMSTSLPGSNNKISVQNRDAQTTKLRNKTRDDVKKNFSTLIENSETGNLTKQNSDKNELHETRHSDLNLSDLMALAQSTQYPDDSLDMSNTPEKKSLVSEFFTTENKNQPKDSGIDEDSTEESAKLKGKCKKVIENKKNPLKQKCMTQLVINNIRHIDNSFDQDETLCPEIEDSLENKNVRKDDTLQNNENAYVKSDNLHKGKHPLKVIGSEIVNQKYKIIQEETTEIHQEERNDEDIDTVGFENCDKSESLNWKLEENEENGEEREEMKEEKSDQRNIKKDGQGKKSNIQKGGMEEESEDEIENKTEESDEDLGKIKKFIIKKPIDKKLLKQKRYQKQKLETEKLSIRELEKKEGSSEEKSEKKNKKAKVMRKETKRREEKRRCDLEKLLYSNNESEFEEQDTRKESPNKNQEKQKHIQRNTFTSKKELEIEQKKNRKEIHQEKEEKVFNSAEDSESGVDRKRIEIQQQNDKIIERRKVEDEEEKSSSEEDSKSEKDEKREEVQQKKDKIERRRMEEKAKESTYEEDSENGKEMRIEIHQQNNKIIQRRKVEEEEEKSGSEEDLESEEDGKRTKVQQKKNKVERRKIEEKEEDQLEIEEQKKNDDSSETKEEEDDRDDYKDQEKEEFISNDEVILKVVEKSITENEDSNKEDNSRQVFTQIVDRENDSESEEEKQDEEELKLTVEYVENYVNLDDNNITIEEHKISIPENHDAEENAQEEEETRMSAESVKKLQQVKKLNFTLGSDSSSSDEEFSQAQINRFKNFIRKEKSDSSDSESEEDVKKKSPKKKVLKSPKKKKDLQEKSPKKKKTSEDVVESSDESKENEKKKTEVVQRGENNDNYIQEGIAFFEKDKDERDQNSSQIIEDVETQNLESSQIISDPDSQICLGNEKKVSRKNKEKETEAECLNYVLSRFERKNERCNKEIEHQIVLEEIRTVNNNENATPGNWKKMTELQELVERDNLVEQKFSSTINLQDISDSEEIWMIQIPKKEISTDLVGKQLSYNGSKFKLGENSYKASGKRIQSLTYVLNSLGSKRPYKTVNIRPVGCITVGPKDALNTLSAGNQTEKKKRKSSNVQDSPVNVSTKEVHAGSEISRKLKKKKLFSEDSILAPKDYKSTDQKLGENKIESSHILKSVDARSKRKRINFLSESEEEEKVESKVDTKRKKNWDVNEYALDEKPPISPPENLSVKNHKTYKRIDNESDSSDMELCNMEKKPKKEKQKKEQLNQPDITKPKSETSSTSFTKAEKYSSLDVSKVKVKNNKEHTNTDSSLNNERVKNEKHKKRKKLDNSNIGEVSELEKVEEKFQTKIDMKPEEKKKKKKSRRDSEKLNNLSTGNKIDKMTEEENLKNVKLSKTSHKSKEETLDGQDFSSDFEVEDKRKSEKKLKKKSCFQNIFNGEGVKNQEEVKPKKEKTKNKIQGFIDFDH